MKRIVHLLCVVALMPCAAFAETYNYTSVSTDGNASVHITQDVSDQSNTTVIVNGQTVYSGNNTMPSRLAPAPSAAAAVNAPQQHSSETHVTQHLETRNGTSSGSVHVYRAENGAVVEDRVIPITGSANLPVSVSANATAPAPAADTLSGFFSHLAETTKPQWRGLRIFGPDAPQISASTSARGLLSFSVSEHQSPLEQFFNRIFSFLHF